MNTKIFHITFYDYDLSAYIHFLDCNFKCRGCIRKISIWDNHLPTNVRNNLKLLRSLKIEELRDIVNILIRKYSLKRVVLGGGEPTTDSSLPSILSLLESLNIEVKLLTNAYSMDSEVASMLARKGCEAIVSIKSIDPSKHLDYTGFPLNRVLENFSGMYRLGVNVSVETILIPGFNDPIDIVGIAKYISSINSGIQLIIDSYVPVPGSSWRRPNMNELEEAEYLSKQYLSNVYCRG
ncbi:MAG: radical SAM protein, partial [Candidatus Methanomethylicia archaeon]